MLRETKPLFLLTSLDSSSLDTFSLLLLFAFFDALPPVLPLPLLPVELFVSFLAGGGFLPRPLVPLRPTTLVSSSAASPNKSIYCF